MRKLITIFSSLALLFSLTGTVAAAPGSGGAKDESKSHNLHHPLGDRQAKLKSAAEQAVLSGKKQAVGANKVVKVANGQFVELAFEGEDQILTLLGEFGETINPVTGGTPGPLHNQIPEPDRTVDNTTIWEEDFNQDYYENLLYNKAQNPSMANYYLEQSSGRYSVNGDVGDWVTVPNNEARYGTNLCGSIICSTVWLFVRDQINAWWAELVADTGSVAAANAYLATFDVWDRYDFDQDGNFNEPDGYIDHFQSVHAGIGEETCTPDCDDAIWSHRWYVFFNLIGAVGPTVGGEQNLFGGLQIGGAGGSNYWIGDYTIEPENGGVGVFAHEFAHDLGLPDEYDTSGNTGGAENGTAWWTLMSQGSYGTQSNTQIGDAPDHMNAWDKFQLGWLNYGVAVAGKNSSWKLGPAETNTKQNQGVFVILPQKFVTFDIGDPFAGTNFYHSGAGNNLDNSMTREVTLGAGPITLSFQARYHIEACWDYAYVEVSTNGGASFSSIPTSVSTNNNENGANFGNGITGTSGTPTVCDQFGTPVWVPVTADLSPYANSTIQLRLRYWTDGAVVGQGFGVDEIAITGLPTDGAETDAGWTFDGFEATDGETTVPFNNYYLAEFRQYRGYDKGLEVGPYSRTQGDSEGNFVEHFPYQDGVLIWYWDTSHTDNNVGDHPGEGLLLPVDAHPGVLHWSDGSTARPRLQSYDATFGLWATDPLSLLQGGLTLTAPSLPAVSVFNDLNDYWVSGDPGDAPANGRYQAEWNSVNTPNTGTEIRIISFSSQGQFVQIDVK